MSTLDERPQVDHATGWQPRKWANWLDPSTARLLRISLVAVALIPLTVLLATRVSQVLDDPLFGIYAAIGITALTLVMFVAFAFYRDPSLRVPTISGLPLVSCLVAVKDEELMIDRCLRSLAAQTYPNAEIIVVDDGSTDGTRRIIEELSEELQLRIVLLDKSIGKKKALTRGAELALGTFLVFTDSDCVLEPDAVERAMRAFLSDPEIGALSGHARALNADETFLTKVQDTWYEGQFSVWKAAESVFGCVTCISGPFAAFRREAVLAFLPAWADDTFLGREFPFATDRQLTGYVLGAEYIGDRLRRRYGGSAFVQSTPPPRNWKIAYVKSARVRTTVPNSFRRLVRQQIRWKKSFLRNLFFTGSFYWRKGLIPSFLFYSHVLFVLMMPVMWIRHMIYMPLTGAYLLMSLYVVGVFLKGAIWAVAYKVENPRCHRWVYRPFMSILAALCFSPLILYSACTIRRGTWIRG